MKNWMFIFCVLFGSSYFCPAQTNQTPPATPPASQTPRRPNREVQQNTQVPRVSDTNYDALRNLDIPIVREDSSNMINEDIQILYRKPNKSDLKNLLPAQTVLTQYTNFLEQPNTGIFKLSADSTCASNAKVVVATENCLLNNIPGGGTAYSFREKSHRILHLADLVLEKDVIKSNGILQQGILVNLGNIEIEEVSAQTKGLNFLFKFKPTSNIKELQKIDQELNNGIKVDEFSYGFGLYADDKTTYAIRSIAYRGKVPRSVNGVNYDEMDFDKRMDIIVVFRIIEKEPNGNLTIIWKELSRKNSPVLKIPQKDK